MRRRWVVHTIENDQAVKVFQTEAYAEAAGGWRYLIAETKGHQLAIVISTIDDFEDCTMDQYTFDGKSLKQTAHQSVFMVYRMSSLMSISKDIFTTIPTLSEASAVSCPYSIP